MPNEEPEIERSLETEREAITLPLLCADVLRVRPRVTLSCLLLL